MECMSMRSSVVQYFRERPYVLEALLLDDGALFHELLFVELANFLAVNWGGR